MNVSTVVKHPRAVMALLMAAALAGAACGSTPNVTQPDDSVYGDTGGANVADVGGFAWDPEAFWISLATCAPKPCAVPPILVPHVPMYENSIVRAAVVNLFDPVQPQTLAGTAAPTPLDGTWTMTGVPSRSTPPFFTQTTLDSTALGGQTALHRAPPLGVVPNAGYLPTRALRPIVTRYTGCYGLSADMISDKGIVEAVANYLNATSGPTTVQDLLDRTKYGGVVVIWLYAPGSSVVRVPAFGTTMQASVGRVLNIAWAPPGVLPPALHQSTRGFYVDASAPVSGIGVTVTLLPAAATPAPTTVTFTPVDPQTTTGHPYSWFTLPPVPVSAGIVTFGQLLGLVPGTLTPPNWVCVN